MAQYQDPNFNSTNKWDYNCTAMNDLDYLIRWGDFENDNTLTIKRDNMTKMKLSIRCWNSKDGWITKSKSKYVQGGSTSDPYTFDQLTFQGDLAHHVANPNYMGIRYIIEGKLELVFNNGESIETYITSVNGCFLKYDPHYYPEYAECDVPAVECADD